LQPLAEYRRKVIAMWTWLALAGALTLGGFLGILLMVILTMSRAD
jgi:hypothetical protein